MFQRSGGIEDRGQTGDVWQRTCWLTYWIDWRDGEGSLNANLRLGKRWFSVNLATTHVDQDR